jgi:hypothetical protein
MSHTKDRIVELFESERTYQQDIGTENDILTKDCPSCEQKFIGQQKRVVCKVCLNDFLKENWISTKHKMPEPYRYVLIVRDVTKWDAKRPIEVEAAYVGFFEEEREVGGPRSLTGYHKIKGLYFAVPAILHPDSVTYWQPLPGLPDKKD